MFAILIVFFKKFFFPLRGSLRYNSLTPDKKPYQQQKSRAYNNLKFMSCLTITNSRTLVPGRISWQRSYCGTSDYTRVGCRLYWHVSGIRKQILNTGLLKRLFCGASVSKKVWQHLICFWPRTGIHIHTYINTYIESALTSIRLSTSAP